MLNPDLPPLHRVDLAIDAACRHCNYRLAGLARAGQCPECGSPFDLNDPPSFAGRHSRRLRAADLAERLLRVERTVNVVVALAILWGETAFLGGKFVSLGAAVTWLLLIPVSGTLVELLAKFA